MNKIFLSALLAILFACSLVSCSSDDYVNAVPSNSVALLSIDPTSFNEEQGETILKHLFGNKDISNSGINVRNKMYAFETIDGNIGFCLSLGSSDKFKDFLSTLDGEIKCGPIKSKSDCTITDINGHWAIVFSSDAALVMGPVTPASLAETQQKMSRYLRQDEEHSVKSTQIYERLDTIQSPIAIVAKAKALPDKLVAPFTLCKKTATYDYSKIYIAANIVIDNKTLIINGKTFSFDKEQDKALRETSATYRKIEGKYIPAFSNTTIAGIFTNIDGKEFLPILQSNPTLQGLMAGINVAIDLDNIIKSIDGDMAFQISSWNTEIPEISLSAQLHDYRWLSDIAYWKESCPQGSKIVDWKKDAYCYTNGSTSFYFGVSPDQQFYSGANVQMAEQCLTAQKSALPNKVQDIIKNGKMVFVLNLNALAEADAKVGRLLRPILGNLTTVVYNME